MDLININKALKTPHPGWELLKGSQAYRAHMGKSYANGVI